MIIPETEMSLDAQIEVYDRRIKVLQERRAALAQARYQREMDARRAPLYAAVARAEAKMALEGIGV